MKRRILVWCNDTMAKCFTDWWDFADFVKQENLAGRDVTIHRWEYS